MNENENNFTKWYDEIIDLWPDLITEREPQRHGSWPRLPALRGNHQGHHHQRRSVGVQRGRRDDPAPRKGPQLIFSYIVYRKIIILAHFIFTPPPQHQCKHFCILLKFLITIFNKNTKVSWEVKDRFWMV